MAHFVSDHQLSKFSHAYQSMANKAHRAVTHAREQKANIKGAVECVGGAGAVGFVRGKMEDANGEWNVPGTTLDIELVAGVVGMGVAIGAPHLVGKYADDLLEVSKGVAAHYAGQIGRKFGKTGTFSLVAGGSADIIGAGALENALSGSGL